LVSSHAKVGNVRPKENIMKLNQQKIIRVAMGLISIATFSLLVAESKAQDIVPKCSDTRFIEGQNDWLFWDYDFDVTPIWQPQLMSYLERFHQALQKQGVKLVVLPIPSKGTMVRKNDLALSEYQWSKISPLILEGRTLYQQSIQDLSTRGFTVVDLMAAAQQAEATQLPNEHFFLKSDHHWSPFGARVAAEAITKTIKKFPQIYQSLQKQGFVLKEVSKLPFLGSVGASYKASCNLDWTKEAVSRFELQTLDNGSQSLLGNANTDVVLAGTSNSQSIKDFNFPGFLSRELETPLLNYSNSARYLLGWLAAYLTSDDYKAAKPKVLIWEFPLLFWTERGIKSDNQIPWLRHLIPSVYGACAGKNLVYSQKVTTKKDILSYSLFRRQNSVISGNRYYIHLTSANKSLKKVQFNLEYENLARETIELNFENNTDNNGHFYLELSDSIQSALTSVEIKIPSVQTVLNMQICTVR
jgi:alginate biosynthesis protein AlgX